MKIQNERCHTLPCARCRAMAAICCRLPRRRRPPRRADVLLRGLLLLRQVLLGQHARDHRRLRRQLLPPLLWGFQLQRRARAAAGACQLCPLRFFAWYLSLQQRHAPVVLP
jgi:hypothetical protein